MLTPLKHKRFSDQIADQIFGLIKSGELKPGDALPSEREMAESLGVSHPPLREALKILETRGLIEIQPRRRVRVKSIMGVPLRDPLAQAIGDDLDMVIQLLQVRKILESWAASKAAELATDEDIARLEAVFEELKDDFQRDHLGVDADSKFHLAVYQAARNTILSHIVSTLFDSLWQGQRVIRESMFKEHENKQRLLRQHYAILDAIRARDPQKARRAIIAHLDFAERKILELASSH